MSGSSDAYDNDVFRESPATYKEQDFTELKSRMQVVNIILLCFMACSIKILRGTGRCD